MGGIMGGMGVVGQGYGAPAQHFGGPAGYEPTSAFAEEQHMDDEPSDYNEYSASHGYPGGHENEEEAL
jgi:hypothetical protein